MKTRIIAVQGTTHLLNVLTNLRYEQNVKKIEYRDILIIHSLDDYRKKHLETLYLMSSIWNFEKIIVMANEIGEMKLSDILNEIRSPNVDSIYLLRDTQPINKLLIYCFPEAKKYFYGDSLGIIDTSNIIKDDKYYYRTIFPFIYSKDSKIEFNIEIIPIQYLNSILKELSNLEIIKKEIEKISIINQEIQIYLTSYFYKIGNLTKEKEIEIYFKQIEKQFNLNNLIYIKKHPRENENIIELLLSKLKDINVDVFILEDILAYLPIEVILFSLKSKKIKLGSVFSTSQINIKVIDSDIEIFEDINILKEIGLIENYEFSKEMLNCVNRLSSQEICFYNNLNNLKRLDSYSEHLDIIKKLIEILKQFKVNTNYYLVGYGEYFEKYRPYLINVLSEENFKGFLTTINISEEKIIRFDKKEYKVNLVNKEVSLDSNLLIVSSFSKEISQTLENLGFQNIFTL